MPCVQCQHCVLHFCGQRFVRFGCMAGVERDQLDIYLDGPSYLVPPTAPAIILHVRNGDDQMRPCPECGCDIHVRMDAMGCVKAGNQV